MFDDTLPYCGIMELADEASIIRFAHCVACGTRDVLGPKVNAVTHLCIACAELSPLHAVLLSATQCKQIAVMTESAIDRLPR